jgi:small subunit ribosomal protein S20
MANIKSAKKRIGVIEKKTQRNKRVKAHLREIVKGFDSATAENNVQEARDFLALAEKKLLQAGAKGTIHKNAASRKVSRLTKQFIKAFGADSLDLKANPPSIPTPEEKAAIRAEKESEREAALARKKGRRRDTRAEAEKTPEAATAPADAEVSEEAPKEVSEEVVAEEVSETADTDEAKAEEPAEIEESADDAETPDGTENVATEENSGDAETGEAPEDDASGEEDAKTPEENAD